MVVTLRQNIEIKKTSTMKLIFTTLIFAFGTLTTFVNAETQNSNTPIIKRVTMEAVSNVPIVDYANGYLSVETTSGVNNISVTIVDQSGAIVYRGSSNQSATASDFFVSLNSGEVYTVITTTDGIRHYDIINL